MQTMPEKLMGIEKVVLSADENPFGVEIKKINEDYDLTKNYYKDYDNSGLEKIYYFNYFLQIKNIHCWDGESGYCQYGRI